MAGEAQRGVRFTLKAQTDASVGREFNAVAERAARIQAMLADFKLGGLDVGQLSTSVDRAHAALDALQRRTLTPITLTAGLAQPTARTATATPGAAARAPGGKTPTNVPPDLAALKTSLDKVVADHKAAEAQMDAGTTNGAAKRAAANGHAAQLEADQEKTLTEQTAAQTEKRAALPEKVVRNRIAMLARVQKADADNEKQQHAASDRQIAQLQKQADAEQKAANQRGGAKVVDNLWDKDAAAKEKAEELNGRLRKSLAEVASGAAELAHGFVELGLIGEDDFNKIKDQILAVQSAMDQVRGVVNVWHSLSEAAGLYGERLETVAKAEQAAAAVKTATGAAQATSGVGGAASTIAGVPAGVAVAGAPVALWAAAGLAVFGAGKVISESLHDLKGPVDQFGFALTGLRHKIIEGEVSFLAMVKGSATGTLGKGLGSALFDNSLLGVFNKLPELFGGKSFT
ncbi:MAG TPA: cell envelope integrity protein TolA, partial [Pirellulales bacterium]|nr:cell envelope integrity protein TolA [Pirellulales bacterium]